MMTDGINAAHTKLGSSIPKGYRKTRIRVIIERKVPYSSNTFSSHGSQRSDERNNSSRNKILDLEGIALHGLDTCLRTIEKHSARLTMDRATGALIIRVGLKATAEISNIAKRMSANCIVNFLLYSTSERQIE